MKINVVSIFIVLLALTSCVNNSTSKRNKNMDTLNLTQEWDKTFPKSDKQKTIKMKTKILWLLTLIMLTVSGCSADEVKTDLPDNSNSEEPAVPTEDRKALIVYFSHTGNTRTIAGYIHDAVESDMVELQTEEPYTDDYDTLLEQAREEMAAGYCPPLVTQIDSIDSYDMIFVGYPNWAMDIPRPVASFLSDYNFEGKTVILFCTHDGYGAAGTFRSVAEAAAGAKVLDGFAVEASDVPNAESEVQQWLTGLGIDWDMSDTVCVRR